MGEGSQVEVSATNVSLPDLHPDISPSRSLLKENPPLEGKFCLYISGATGGKHTAEPIQKALEGVYGENNVQAVASIISIDPQNKKEKYRDLAETIFEKIGDGKIVTIIGYSGGAIELVDVIKAMEAINKNIDEWATKIKIVLAAPAGLMRNPSEGLESFRNVCHYVKEIFGIGHTAKAAAGLNSFYLFPPDPSDINYADLVKAIQETMFDEAQYVKGSTPLVSFDLTNFQTDERFLPYIEKAINKAKEQKRELRKELRDLDTDILKAATAKNRPLLHSLLAQRGELLSEPLKQVYDSIVPEVKGLLPVAKIYSQMLLGLAHICNEARNGEVVSTIEQLRDSGTDISFMTPQYDKVFPLKNPASQEYIRQLSQQDISDAVVGLDLSGHASWVTNPKVFAAALRELEQRPQK